MHVGYGTPDASTAINPCYHNNGGCGNPHTTLCHYVKPGVAECTCIEGFISKDGRNCFRPSHSVH